MTQRMSKKPPETLQLFTLPTGHTLVCMQARTPVGCFGFTVKGGSRYETAPETHGLAHFVEHTIFKGTTHRRAHHINSRMEAVGGELNAFTTKEEITFYTIFPKGNLARASQLLADLAYNPTFPERELNKEREVVCEEINSYLDSPAELVFDEFENRIFSGSTLGHSILGTEKNLAGFTSEICRTFVDGHFLPTEMILFYSGSESASHAYATISRHFQEMAGDSSVTAVKPPHRQQTIATVPQFSESRETGAHQAHTVIGAQVPGIFSTERTALALLTNIICGPGMNSRLNADLRERRGLVYSADASLSLMADCGLFTAYFGCSPEDMVLCSDLTAHIITDLQRNPPSGRRIEAAKKQYLGQLKVAAASLEQTTLSMAHSALITGEVAPAAKLRSEIEAVTPEELSHAASLLSATSRLTLC